MVFLPTARRQTLAAKKGDSVRAAAAAAGRGGGRRSRDRADGGTEGSR